MRNASGSLRCFYHETEIPMSFNQFQAPGAWGGTIMIVATGLSRSLEPKNCNGGDVSRWRDAACTPDSQWLREAGMGALAPEWLR
jgi:hypothetical protein